jgi:succinate dehydrogenase / fumarate reductase membrane anchor subunit
MVTNVTALSRTGLSDWLIQRVSAVVVASYVIFLLGFFLFNQPVTFVSWYELFNHLGMRIYTLLVLIALLAHTWIGMWTIITDYIKPTWLRLLVEVVIGLALSVYLFWGIYLLYNA